MVFPVHWISMGIIGAKHKYTAPEIDNIINKISQVITGDMEQSSVFFPRSIEGSMFWWCRNLPVLQNYAWKVPMRQRSCQNCVSTIHLRAKFYWLCITDSSWKAEELVQWFWHVRLYVMPCPRYCKHDISKRDRCLNFKVGALIVHHDIMIFREVKQYLMSAAFKVLKLCNGHILRREYCINFKLSM